MMQYRVSFESPWYLLLLVLVPVLWWLSYRSMGALGQGRRWTALVLRSVVLVLFILALAQTQMIRISERLTVIYLLDQSQSIPQDARRKMVEYVNKSIERHRKNDDRVGVIVFGREAAIEVPAFDYNVQLPSSLETPIDSDYTNLAAAVRLALASFPEDAARRIVVVSDGNENLGSALEEARSAAGAGVGIDVVPVNYRHQGEVIVDRVALPGDVRRGQPFDVKVVVTNSRPAAGNGSGAIGGKLTITRNGGGQSTVVSEEHVTLPPGKKVFTVRQQLDTPSFFTYEAKFAPDNPADDTMPQNNRATAFTHIQGKGQVLIIENNDKRFRGAYDAFAQALRLNNIEVTVRQAQNAFASLAELQQFDSIVLANVPKDDFGDDGQIQVLVRNTQQMGCGLVMIGGEDSFGAGGWENTELEKAMPVDFTIKAAKVIPRGALAMVMHASEIAQGNFWQKKIGEEALKTLGPRDYCGVIQYTGGGAAGGTDWLWKPGMMPVGENREVMLGKMSRMTPQDMPDFDPGLKLAYQGLMAVKDAGVRHMIVISDGDPTAPSGAVLRSYAAAKITISTVAVGAHGPANSQTLKSIADATGGKYYQVNNANALPRIFQREARRVRQPLIYEKPAGLQPQLTLPHEMLNGVGTPPPITGFVLTTRKENPLVEVSMVSPEPGNVAQRTLLASWTYGLGRAVAVPTDLTSRWCVPWIGWQNYTKLVGQIVRWSMRPVGDEGKFNVATEYQDGQVRVVVTALDKNDEFLNFLNMALTAVGPGLGAQAEKSGEDKHSLGQLGKGMEQVAPGRYVATFPAQDAGSYMIAISPGPGRAPIRTGINVPFSEEFRNLETNQALLDQLAQLTPEGSEAGQVIQSPDGLERMEPLLEVSSFRHDLPKATSSQDIWPLLLLVGSCLFFWDVFVRRVQVNFTWVPVLAAKVLGRKPPPPVVQTIERLRSRKAEVQDRIAQLRASARFEPTPETPADTSVIEEPAEARTAAKPAAPAPTLVAESEDDSYTARLLKAKEKAWEQRKQ